MKKLILTLASSWLFISLVTAQMPYSQKVVESLSMKDFHNNRGSVSLDKADFSYVPGLVAKSVLKTYFLYPEKTEYFAKVKAYADRQLTNNPERPINIHSDDIDAINAGKIFIDLYRICSQQGDNESAARYKEAATYLYKELKTRHTRINDSLPGAGGFIHKGRYPYQMWLDGLYMGSAFLAEWEACFGEKNDIEAWADIALQFKTIHRYTWDAGKQLNYHAWSAKPDDPNSFWANQQEPYLGASKEFWARGCGWYFAALADVLEVMPKNHPDYHALLSIFRDVAKGLRRWQDSKSGCWYQLLQYDDKMTADGIGDFINGRYHNVGTLPNYLESSASGMFTYAFAKGVRLKLLDRNTYLPTIRRAYQGLLKTFVTFNEDHSINIMQSCASAGLGPARNPNRSGTINYYLCGNDVSITFNEGKAIGSFTMAFCEYERLTSVKRK